MPIFIPIVRLTCIVNGSLTDRTDNPSQSAGLFIVVMGVAGSGKTTVGRLLAARLGCPFYDADDYHPPANIAKMSAGRPLNDADRADWLVALGGIISGGLARGEWGVLACSALKRAYRAVLRVDEQRVRFVYLRGDYDAIQARLRAREGHFLPAALLQSQFDALEEPTRAIHVDVGLEPDQIVAAIMEQLF